MIKLRGKPILNLTIISIALLVIGVMFFLITKILPQVMNYTNPPQIESLWDICDLNHSGSCDSSDKQIFQKTFGKCRGENDFNFEADIDGDGCVVTADENDFMASFGCQEINDLTFENAFSVDKSLCEQCGGHWGIGPHNNGCNPKTLDAGKTCTDNSQCKGLCLAEQDDENVITGKCSQDKFVFGCNREIINSKAQPILCRDD